MKTAIIAIGNSKGLRLPKVMLEESGITKNVDIKITKKGLLITPIEEDEPSDVIGLAEASLSKDWDRPEEDAAWADL